MAAASSAGMGWSRWWMLTNTASVTGTICLCGQWMHLVLAEQHRLWPKSPSLGSAVLPTVATCKLWPPSLLNAQLLISFPRQWHCLALQCITICFTLLHFGLFSLAWLQKQWTIKARNAVLHMTAEKPVVALLLEIVDVSRWKKNP